MIISRFILLISMLLTFAGTASAQQLVYKTDNSIKVYDNGSVQEMAWCGGVNNPQFAMADLDLDGKNDLVIFEPGIGVKTFLNTGSRATVHYTYAPGYERFFPAVNDFLKLEDYNNDRIPDLIHRGRSGFSIHKGYYGTDNKLRFKYYKDLFYKQPTGGDINAYTEPNDIPAVADVDGDGDLDFLSYYIGGGYISFYKNCRVEEGLPADSIKICLSDNCWGKVYQAFERTQHLGTSCSSFGVGCKGCEQAGNKTTHTGNTLCLLDYDGDKDYDYFNGNNAFPDVQLLINGKREYAYPIDTMIAQDTVWGAGGRLLANMQWPAAFWQDIDNDGDKDILFSPHGRGAENYRCISFYENTGTTTTPAYTYRSDTFLIEQMIDVGTGAYPVLYDYNKDGKQDLFVGTEGYYQPNGSFRSRISYYENTSTGTDLSFTLKTKDFLNIHALSITGAIPAIGDIDHDGKDDLIIGKLDGTLIYYHNTASTAGDVPNWQLQSGNLKDETGKDINAGGFAAPFVYDIDKDGKKDLLIGGRSGSLIYYRNTNSTAGHASFQHQTDTLGGVRTAPPFSAYGYSVPFIGKIDDTGREYLLLGSQSGTLYRYDGFQNGNTSTSYTRLDTAYMGIKAATMSAPTIADLDGDGKYEIISGNIAGGLNVYRLGEADTDDEITSSSAPASVRLFPNPATSMVTFAWQPAFIQDEVSINIVSATGQRVAEGSVSAPAIFATIDIAHLRNGIYYCIVISGKNRQVLRLSVLNE